MSKKGNLEEIKRKKEIYLGSIGVSPFSALGRGYLNVESPQNSGIFLALELSKVRAIKGKVVNAEVQKREIGSGGLVSSSPVSVRDLRRLNNYYTLLERNGRRYERGAVPQGCDWLRKAYLLKYTTISERRNIPFKHSDKEEKEIDLSEEIKADVEFWKEFSRTKQYIRISEELDGRTPSFMRASDLQVRRPKAKRALNPISFEIESHGYGRRKAEFKKAVREAKTKLLSSIRGRGRKEISVIRRLIEQEFGAVQNGNDLKHAVDVVERAIYLLGEYKHERKSFEERKAEFLRYVHRTAKRFPGWLSIAIYECIYDFDIRVRSSEELAAIKTEFEDLMREMREDLRGVQTMGVQTTKLLKLYLEREERNQVLYEKEPRGFTLLTDQAVLRKINEN